MSETTSCAVCWGPVEARQRGRALVVACVECGHAEPMPAVEHVRASGAAMLPLFDAVPTAEPRGRAEPWSA